MAFTTIAKPSVHFDCPTWVGSDSVTTISGMGFKPDSLWINGYEGGDHPVLNNSTEGTGQNWSPSGNNANHTTVKVASYTSDGFTLTGNIADTNDASNKYVAACWKANGGVTSSNTSGSITSTVQADTTSGVSIIQWTGTGANGTIGHGLGVAPKVVITKSTATADKGLMLNMGKTIVADPETDQIQFAATSDGDDDADAWNDTAPTSSVISIGSKSLGNASSQTCIAYAFAEVQGFSKFGFYVGNENVQGPKIYCGFKPRWILIKGYTYAGDDWMSKSSGLTGYGLGGARTRSVIWNRAYRATNATVQYESNGFRILTADWKINKQDAVFIYMAFAEMPMVGTNGTIALAT